MEYNLVLKIKNFGIFNVYPINSKWEGDNILTFSLKTESLESKVIKPLVAKLLKFCKDSGTNKKDPYVSSLTWIVDEDTSKVLYQHKECQEKQLD